MVIFRQGEVVEWRSILIWRDFSIQVTRAHGPKRHNEVTCHSVTGCAMIRTDPKAARVS